MALDTGRTGLDGHAPPDIGLFNENARLRRLLLQAEDFAARQTMLLRECDHRVKNSLQVVVSLLELQAKREASATVCHSLESAAARVQAIAGIHDALQATAGEDVIDLGAALETMCRSLHAMGGETRAISVLVNVEAIHAPVAIAQPILLAANELVINALQHAFQESHAGTVRVSATRSGGELCVIVSDNGCGLAPGYGDSQGFGMKLVRRLSGQIGATLRVESQSGAHFTLTVPTSRGMHA